MFSSRSRRQYQTIDEDYDEEDLRNSSGPPGSLAPFSSREGQYSSTAESAPLMGATSIRPNDRDDVTIGPMLMASSSEHRWDHINDLDEFFRRVYDYHQGGGFHCILWKHIWSLIQFIFVVTTSTFLLQCLDYQTLFNNKEQKIEVNATIKWKRHFGDAVQCPSSFHPLIILCIFCALLFWISRVIRTTAYLLKLKEIQLFYSTALSITDVDLPNLTWKAVVDSICKAQPRLHLMIHDETITSIDVYQRILRFNNYMVALVNKGLMPPILNIPFVGEVPYLPSGLKTNLEWLLFWGFQSPFRGSFTLAEEYKNPNNIDVLAANLEKCVFYLGMFNLLLSPLMFIYLIFYSFYTVADLTKRDAGAMGARRYSNYARYRLRHFNELDHELRARLNRSYRFAHAYVSQFYSPLLEVFARNISFIAASIAGVLTVLSVWDEDVIQIEHVLLVITVSGLTVVVCRSFIRDENLVWQPEVLLELVTAEINYVPNHWKGRAHDHRVRGEFEQLFRLKAMYILEELSSPLLTPFILLFHVRPQCKELLLFLSENTISDPGRGDVCSFAMMDVARHGDPAWQKMDEEAAVVPQPTDQPAEHGKTELSAVHFATMNPDWQPPPASAAFLSRFRGRMDRDLASIRNGASTNVLLESMSALMQMPRRDIDILGDPLSIDGPVNGGGALYTSLRGSLRGDSLARSLRESGNEVSSAGGEMRVNALFLRNLQMSRRGAPAAYASMAPASDSVFNLPSDDLLLSHRPNSDQHHSDEEHDGRPPFEFRAV